MHPTNLKKNKLFNSSGLEPETFRLAAQWFNYYRLGFHILIGAEGPINCNFAPDPVTRLRCEQQRHTRQEQKPSCSGDYTPGGGGGGVAPFMPVPRLAYVWK
jgi:hypothetical protein